ncbi:MAG: cytochrome c maturation protein CcmE [Acetobacteraceae bacterium]|nr:cytochrome c maturation protein CcmE [Acetobacteraceae bacterium]
MALLRTRKGRRLAVLLLCLVGLGSAAGLALLAFRDNLVFFVTPGDLAEAPPPAGRMLRLGGLVEAGSVARDRRDGKPVARFRVTDGRAALDVEFAGILPDLFREGQGVVALGTLRPDGSFLASEVLAKHDETYMPPEVAAALKKAGHWQPESAPAPPAAGWNTLTPRKSGG